MRKFPSVVKLHDVPSKSWANFWRERHEASPPKEISASGRERCRAARRVADCGSAAKRGCDEENGGRDIGDTERANPRSSSCSILKHIDHQWCWLRHRCGRRRVTPPYQTRGE